VLLKFSALINNSMEAGISVVKATFDNEGFCNSG
jgi:hypothetical protein